MANIKAPKINQTVVLENPDKAHRILSAGLGPAKPRTATRKTPINPTAAAGRGSRIRPKITALKMAKKYQAVRFNPWGAGSKAIIIPKSKGRTAFHGIVFIFNLLVFLNTEATQDCIESCSLEDFRGILHRAPAHIHYCTD
jgi:hypothetical protein